MAGYPSISEDAMHRFLLALTVVASAIALAPSAMAQHHAHHVVIQIDENDAHQMNLALNNAENMQTYWDKRHETSSIEFVAFGPGLNMVRTDEAPDVIKQRIAALSKKGVRFSGCGNTMMNQEKQEGRSISLIADVHVVPTGVARITELEEQGYTYLRP